MKAKNHINKCFYSHAIVWIIIRLVGNIGNIYIMSIYLIKNAVILNSRWICFIPFARIFIFLELLYHSGTINRNRNRSSNPPLAAESVVVF